MEGDEERAWPPLFKKRLRNCRMDREAEGVLLKESEKWMVV
jgi:hypothetical protein